MLVPANGGLLPKPDKENVTGHVDVAVVLGTKFRVFPVSYSEHVLTLGASCRGNLPLSVMAAPDGSHRPAQMPLTGVSPTAGLTSSSGTL
jgi:hypothetical protein